MNEPTNQIDGNTERKNRQAKKNPGRKFVWKFSQKEVIRMKIDLPLLLLLEHLHRFETTKSSKIKRWFYNENIESHEYVDCFNQDTGDPLDESDGVHRYTWITTQKILYDIPILGVSERQVQNYLKKLKDKKLLKMILVKGKFRYFRIDEEFFNKIIEQPEVSLAYNGLKSDYDPAAMMQ